MASFAWLRNVLACAAALRASLLHREKSLLHTNLAMAITSSTSLSFTARFSAATMTRLAVAPAWYSNLRGVALGSLLKSDLHVVTQICTLVDLRPWLASTALTEDITKNITKGVCKTATAKTATAKATRLIHARMTILVIGGTFIRVSKDFVSFFSFFELIFGCFAIGIAIRMMLHRHFSIGFF